MALTARDPSNFFQDDDDETFRRFAAGGEVSSRLADLSKRFMEDHDHEKSSGFWKSLIESAKEKDFRFAESLSSAGSSSSAAPDSLDSLPAAFQSDVGTKHLRVTAVLLNVSQKRAAQITLSSLRDVSDATNLQSLLGTRRLVDQVMSYHYRQRSARVAVIAECLRQEQDPTAENHGTIVQTLDALDSTYSCWGKDRGLFRYLVAIACQPDEAVLTRKRLHSLEELQSEKAMSLQEVFAHSSEDIPWKAFVVGCTNATRISLANARMGAMEALLVLLFHRIQDGVQRADYVLLLLALKRSKEFFTGYGADGERLCQLASLSCAECMALWRTYTDDNWMVNHPFLFGIVGHNDPDETRQAEKEFESMTSLLLEYSSAAEERRRQLCASGKLPVPDAPESLALLSFGLLLMLSYSSILESPDGSDTNAYWQVFGEKGSQMAQRASDENAAIDCLHNIMDKLVADQPCGPSRDVESEGFPYDWHFSDTSESAAMEISGPGVATGNEMDAASITYASIGHECLCAVTKAFQDTALSVHNQEACQNIAMICDLASVIYRNSPTLCQPFWVDWEACTSTEPPSYIPPMCNVMDSAFQLAVNVMRVETATNGQMLATVAPLLRLVSSVCYTPENVESALEVLPQQLLRKALLCCAPTSAYVSNDTEFRKLQCVVMQSIAKIVRLGDSKNCRRLIRESLEETNMQSQVTGPNLLFRVVANANSTFVAGLAVEIAAALLDDASVHWVRAVAQSFKRVASDKVFIPSHASLNKTIGALPAARIFNGLVNSLTPFASSESIMDSDVVDFLNLLWNGVISLASLLPMSRSKAARRIPQSDPVPYECVQIIFSFFANLLEQIRPIMFLHNSVDVKSAATGIRDALIEMLGSNSSLGESVIYYAVSPVAFNLAENLQIYAQETKILHFVSSLRVDKDPASATSLGSTVSHDPSTKAIANIREIVLSTGVDLDRVQSTSWRADVDPSIHLGTASAALRLLNRWAGHVDDMITNLDVLDLATPDTPHKSELDFDSKGRVFSLSPQSLLMKPASVPAVCASDVIVSLWESAIPTNLELMVRYLDCAGTGLSQSIPAAVLAIVRTCLSQAIPPGVAVDNVLLMTVLRSKTFFEQLKKRTKCALDVSESNSNRSEVKVDVTLSLLSLHIFRRCVEADASLASPQWSELSQLCFDGIDEAADHLRRVRLSQPHGFNDKALMSQLRVASSLLSVLQSVLACAMSDTLSGKTDVLSRSLCKVMEEKASAFSSLAAVVVQHAQLRLSTQSSPVLNCFIAEALDVLGTATEWVLTSNVSDNLINVIVGIWESLMGQDFADLLTFPKAFVSTSGLTDHAEVVKKCHAFIASFSARMTPSNPDAMLELFPTAAASQRDFELLDNRFDLAAAAKWLALLHPPGCTCETEAYKIVHSLAVSHYVASSQVKVLYRWSEVFATSLSRLINQRNGVGSNAFLPVALETLKSVFENAVIIERVQRDLVESPTFNFSKIGHSLASLTLFFVDKGVSEGSTTTGIVSLIEMLDLVSEASEALFGALISRPETCIHIEKHMLGCAVAVLSTLHLEGAAVASQQQIRICDVLNRLLRTTAKVLTLLEAQIDIAGGDECLKTFLSVISLLIASRLDCNSYPSLFLQTLSNTFVEFDVMNTVVGLGRQYLTSAAVGAGMSAVSPATFEQSVQVASLVFNLILIIAQEGDPKMLRTLASSSALEMVIRNPIFVQKGQPWKVHKRNPITPRGYIASQDKVQSNSKPGASTRSVFVGRDDPVFVLWECALGVFRAILTTSSILDSVLGERFFMLVSDFIVTYQHTMLTCLKACSEFSVSGITMHSLREAASILALLSEFCKRPGRDNLRYLVHEKFFPVSKIMVTRLGSLLGASSASRELFRALSELDAASGTGDMGARFSPFSPGFSMQNAKHEAIRYSHFSSRSSTVVTRKDFESSPAYGSEHSDGSQIGERSAVDLERDANKAMMCEFASNIEQAAAECLYFALSLLWEIHPSASNFVTFSNEEAGRIDAMRLVKPGMVISFFDERTGDKYFAEVQHVDSVHRSWCVRLIGKQYSGAEGIVKAGQLSGVEDVTKRTAIFEFAPAGELSSELIESAKKSATVGHLILALRWCHERANEQGNVSPIVQRLAELLAMFIGTELSVHDQIQSSSIYSKSVVDKLNTQLHDLFGQVASAKRCVNHVLSESSWNNVQQQLENQLESATNAVASANNMSLVERDPYLGVRRSGNRSAYERQMYT